MASSRNPVRDSGSLKLYWAFILDLNHNLVYVRPRLLNRDLSMCPTRLQTKRVRPELNFLDIPLPSRVIPITSNLHSVLKDSSDYTSSLLDPGREEGKRFGIKEVTFHTDYYGLIYRSYSY